jgi:hypothetical protein
MPNPPIGGLRFQPCCQKSLADIKDAVRRGNALGALTATSGLWNLMGSAPLDTAVSVTTTDWSLFAQAAKAAPALTRKACFEIASEEVDKHPGGPLYLFWSTMAEDFE